MTIRSQLVSSFAWPFKTLTRKLFGEQLYQHARATFLHDQGGLGLDWKWSNSLRCVRPIRRDFGWREGQPIDRYYTEEQFLASYEEDIRGRVLEIGDDRYTRQFGGEKVTKSDVLGYLGSPGTTIQADLTKADHIPSDTLDCVILPLHCNSFLMSGRPSELWSVFLNPGVSFSSWSTTSASWLDMIWILGGNIGGLRPCR